MARNPQHQPSTTPFDRRSFLRLSGGCAALSSTSLLSTLLNLKLTNSAIAGDPNLDGYKALVCVFLLGGYDSHNVLAPYEQDEHDDYVAARSNLALPRSELLEITDRGGRSFGVHPGMPEMRDLYNDNNLAFVANIGSLIEPTDGNNFNSVRRPLGLFSHSDLIQHWQTSVPQSRSQVTGWGGRMADILTDSVNQNPSLAMNIALGSLNTFQTGAQVVPYVVQRTGATILSGYGATGTGVNGMYTRFTDDALGQQYGDLLERSFAQTRRSSIDGALSFNNATNAVTLNTQFPDTFLGQNMSMIARTIGARSALQQSRQIFFVSIGGWDHHDEVLDRQAAMLPMVSQALKAFYDATVELGVENEVTTFTASDFARTLSSNGNGSDHAWGGNHMVMGGDVSGGHVFGEYPLSLRPNNDRDLGRGRIIPSLSVDEYNADLACWFGIQNDSSLEEILPNIRNFYASGSTDPAIGLFQGGAVPEPPTGPGGGLVVQDPGGTSGGGGSPAGPVGGIGF